MALNTNDFLGNDDFDIFGVMFDVRTQGLESVKGVINGLIGSDAAAQKARGSLVDVKQVISQLASQGVSAKDSLKWVASGGDDFMRFSFAAQRAASDVLRVSQHIVAAKELAKSSGTEMGESLRARISAQVNAVTSQLVKENSVALASEATSGRAPLQRVASELNARPVIFDLMKQREKQIADHFESVIKQMVPAQRMLMEQGLNFVEQRQQYVNILNAGGKPYNLYANGQPTTLVDEQGRPLAANLSAPVSIPRGRDPKTGRMTYETFQEGAKFGATNVAAKGSSRNQRGAEDPVIPFEAAVAAQQKVIDLRNHAIELFKAATGDFTEAEKIFRQAEEIQKKKGSVAVGDLKIDALGKIGEADAALRKFEADLTANRSIESIAAANRPSLMDQREVEAATQEMQKRLADTANGMIRRGFIGAYKNLSEAQLQELRSKYLSPAQVANPEKFFTGARLEEVRNQIASAKDEIREPEAVRAVREHYEQQFSPLIRQRAEIAAQLGKLRKDKTADPATVEALDREQLKLLKNYEQLKSDMDNEILRVKHGPELAERIIATNKLRDVVGLAKMVAENQTFGEARFPRWGMRYPEETYNDIYSRHLQGSNISEYDEKGVRIVDADRAGKLPKSQRRALLKELNEYETALANYFDDPQSGNLKKAAYLRNSVAQRQREELKLQIEERDEDRQEKQRARLDALKSSSTRTREDSATAEARRKAMLQVLEGQMSPADFEKLYRGKASAENPPRITDQAFEAQRVRLRDRLKQELVNTTIALGGSPDLNQLGPNTLPGSDSRHAKMIAAENKALSTASETRRKFNRDYEVDINRVAAVHEAAQSRMSRREQTLEEHRKKLRQDRVDAIERIDTIEERAQANVDRRVLRTMQAELVAKGQQDNIGRRITKLFGMDKEEAAKAGFKDLDAVAAEIQRLENVQTGIGLKVEEATATATDRNKRELDQARKTKQKVESEFGPTGPRASAMAQEERDAASEKERTIRRLDQIDEALVNRWNDRRRDQIKKEQETLTALSISRQAYEENQIKQIERSMSRRQETTADAANRFSGKYNRIYDRAADQMLGVVDHNRMQFGRFGPPSPGDRYSFPPPPDPEYNVPYERYRGTMARLQSIHDEGWAKIEQRARENAKILGGLWIEAEQQPQGKARETAMLAFETRRKQMAEELGAAREQMFAKDAELQDKQLVAERRYAYEFEQNQQRKERALAREISRRKESLELTFQRIANPQAFADARMNQEQLLFSGGPRPTPGTIGLQLDPNITDRTSQSWSKYERQATAVLSNVERARRKVAAVEREELDMLAHAQMIRDVASPDMRGKADELLAARRIQAQERISIAQRKFQDAETDGYRKLNAFSHQYTQNLVHEEAAARRRNSANNQQNMMNLTAQFLVAYAAVKQTIVGMIEYASRTETMKVVTEQMARVNNLNVRALNSQIEAIKHLNISTQEAHGTVQRMIFAQLDVRKSVALAQVAQNAAVISGENSSVALEKIITGITTGQTRILHYMGLQVSLLQVIRELRMQLGREPTEIEKRQAMLNAVLNEGTKITGSYEAAMLTAGKQLTSLRRQFQEAQNAIGHEFQPAFMQLIGFMGASANLARENASEFAHLTRILGGLAITFGALKVGTMMFGQGGIGDFTKGIARSMLVDPRLGFARGNVRLWPAVGVGSAIALGLGAIWGSKTDAVEGVLSSASTVKAANDREVRELGYARSRGEIDELTYRKSINRFQEQNAALEKKMISNIADVWNERADKISKIWDEEHRRPDETKSNAFFRGFFNGVKRYWDVLTFNADSYTDSGYSIFETLFATTEKNLSDEQKKRIAILRQKILDEGGSYSPVSKRFISAKEILGQFDENQKRQRDAKDDPLYNVRLMYEQESLNAEDRITGKVQKAKESAEQLADRIVERAITDPVMKAKLEMDRELKKYAIAKDVAPIREMLERLGMDEGLYQRYAGLRAKREALKVTEQELDLYKQLIARQAPDGQAPTEGQLTKSQIGAALDLQGLAVKIPAFEAYEVYGKQIEGMELAKDGKGFGFKQRYDLDQTLKDNAEQVRKITEAYEGFLLPIEVLHKKFANEQKALEVRTGSLQYEAQPGLSEDLRVIEETARLKREQAQSEDDRLEKVRLAWNLAHKDNQIARDNFKIAQDLLTIENARILAVKARNFQEVQAARQYQAQQISGRYRLLEEVTAAQMDKPQQAEALARRVYQMKLDESKKLGWLEDAKTGESWQKKQRDLEAEIGLYSKLIGIRKQDVEQQKSEIEAIIKQRFERIDRLMKSAATNAVDEVLNIEKSYSLRMQMIDQLAEHEIDKRKSVIEREKMMEEAKFDRLQALNEAYNKQIQEGREAAGKIFDVMYNRGEGGSDLIKGIFKTTQRTIFQNFFGDMMSRMGRLIQIPGQVTGTGDDARATWLGKLLSGTLFGYQKDPRSEMKSLQDELRASTSGSVSASDRLSGAMSKLEAATIALAQIEAQILSILGGTPATVPAASGLQGSAGSNVNGIIGAAASAAGAIKSASSGGGFSGVTGAVGSLLNLFRMAPFAAQSGVDGQVPVPQFDFPEGSVQDVIVKASRAQGINPAIMLGLAEAESGFRQVGNAQGSGAYGIFQFTKDTAKDYGVDRESIPSQARGASAYMSELLDKSGGDLDEALKRYKGFYANWTDKNGVVRQGSDQAAIDRTMGLISKYNGGEGYVAGRPRFSTTVTEAFNEAAQPEVIPPYQYQGQTGLFGTQINPSAIPSDMRASSWENFVASGAKKFPWQKNPTKTDYLGNDGYVHTRYEYPKVDFGDGEITKWAQNNYVDPVYMKPKYVHGQLGGAPDYRIESGYHRKWFGEENQYINPKTGQAELVKGPTTASEMDIIQADPGLMAQMSYKKGGGWLGKHGGQLTRGIGAGVAGLNAIQAFRGGDIYGGIQSTLGALSMIPGPVGMVAGIAATAMSVIKMFRPDKRKKRREHLEKLIEQSQFEEAESIEKSKDIFGMDVDYDFMGNSRTYKAPYKPRDVVTDENSPDYVKKPDSIDANNRYIYDRYGLDWIYPRARGYANSSTIGRPRPGTPRPGPEDLKSDWTIRPQDAGLGSNPVLSMLSSMVRGNRSNNQYNVKIDALDSKSFIDRSKDIADAVKYQILLNHPVSNEIKQTVLAT